MIILACTKFISAARALLGIRGSVSGLPQMSVSKIETLLLESKFFAQIADAMNFTSLSYCSRYFTKHLGQSPSEYRLSLQPK